MRLLIDLQLVQDESACAGTGHALIALAQAIAVARGGDAVTILLNGGRPGSAAALAALFRAMLPEGAVRVWYPPAPGHSGGGQLDLLAAHLRAEAILDHHPDAVLVCGLPAPADSGRPVAWPETLALPPTFFAVPDAAAEPLLQAGDRASPGQTGPLEMLRRCRGILTLRPPGPDTALSVAPDMLHALDTGAATDAAESQSRMAQSRMVQCGARAWALFHGLPARPAGTDRAAFSAGGRRTLAVVTPVPPQHTGIADYSAELVPALARHYDVTVVSEVRPDPESPLAALPWFSAARFRSMAWRFDRVLYQIGNSPFHQFQVEDLLPRCPGVVVLHDVFLPDYRWAYGDAIGRPPRVLEDLAAAHGYPAVVAALRDGVAPVLLQLPCCAPVITAGVGLIVHSRYALEVLQRHYGVQMLAGARVIPHLRAPPALPERAAARRALGIADDVFLVCSFGEIGPKKVPQIIFKGWARACGQAGKTARLAFVGRAPEGLDASISAAADVLGCRERVIVTGRVDRATYLTWLAAADAAVQLRRNSNGESSGAAADCLGAGVPLVINRHGSFAELPEDVARFVTESAEADEIAAALAELGSQAATRTRLAGAARAFAAAELAPERVATLYRDAIEAAYLEGKVAGALGVVRTAAAYPRLPASQRVALAGAIAATWPPVRQAQLLLQAAEEPSPEDWNGILRTLLSSNRTGRRPEPFHVTAGALVSAHDWAARLLGVPLRTRRSILMPQHGDILLALHMSDGDGGTARTLERLRAMGIEVWRLLRPDADADALGVAIATADGVLCCSSRQAAAAGQVALPPGRAMRVLACDQEDWTARIGERG